MKTENCHQGRDEKGMRRKDWLNGEINVFTGETMERKKSSSQPKRRRDNR